MRTISLVTTSRSEISGLGKLAELLQASPLVSFRPAHYPSPDPAECTRWEGSEITVIFGDRMQSLCAAVAAYHGGSRIVHIHAGERTYGSRDDDYRDAISMLATDLFCAHSRYADRLLKMGIPGHNIHIVGAPSLDRFEDMPAQTRRGYCVATWHPVEGEDVQQLLEALKSYEGDVYWTEPCNDPGYEQVWASVTGSGYRFYHFLDSAFIEAVRHADFVIGNSSMGMIECPSLRVPSVNIGGRQEGRMTGGSTTCVRCDADWIRLGIQWALQYDGDYYNPYFSGASKKIADFLINLPAPLSRKRP